MRFRPCRNWAEIRPEYQTQTLAFGAQEGRIRIHGGHAYSWAKKYAVIMSGEQPVLVFKEEAPVGEEAAGETGQCNTALDQLKLVSHQGLAFEDLYGLS